MKVLHISDLHYRKKFEGGNPYEDMLSSMDSSFKRLKIMLEQVLLQNLIDLIVISGDICDEGSAEDYATIKEYFDSLRVPCIVCLGNHDIRENFYEGWFNEKDKGPYLSEYEANGIHFISFDNSKHGMADGIVEDSRLQWLDEKLQKLEPAIVIMHHQFDAKPGIPSLTGKEKLISLLKQRKVLGVLNGHTHWACHQKIDEIQTLTAPSVSFRAINTKEGSVIFYQSQGYVIYDVTPEKISVVETYEEQGKVLAEWKKKA